MHKINNRSPESLIIRVYRRYSDQICIFVPHLRMSLHCIVSSGLEENSDISHWRRDLSFLSFSVIDHQLPCHLQLRKIYPRQVRRLSSFALRTWISTNLTAFGVQQVCFTKNFADFLQLSMEGREREREISLNFLINAKYIYLLWKWDINIIISILR